MDVTRTTSVVIPITYKRSYPQKLSVKRGKHAIHRAIKWQKLLDYGVVKSKSEIARAEGLSPARVNQIMKLLKLPTEVKEFLAGLEDPKKIRKYSERKLLSESFTLRFSQ